MTNGGLPLLRRLGRRAGSARVVSTLVERRLRYIERQRALQRDAAARDAPRARWAPARGTVTACPAVPAGQRVVPNWPVLDLGDDAGHSARATGVSRSAALRAPALAVVGRLLGAAAGGRRQRLPLRDDVEPLGQPLARRAVPRRWPSWPCRTTRRGSCRAPATTAARHGHPLHHEPAARRAPSKTTCCWCTRGRAQPLPREHGGPCRMITPKLYAWKGTKWIRRIEFLADDRPRLLGSARLLQHRRAVARRSLLDSVRRRAGPFTTGRASVFVPPDLRPCWRPRPSRPPSLVDPTGLLYEPKYDGIRAIVLVEPGPPPRVRSGRGSATRSRRSFPSSCSALRLGGGTDRRRSCSTARSSRSTPKGRPAGFQRLQGRIHVSVPGYRSSTPIRRPEEQPTAFIAFDLLRDGDDDLRALPLTERRARARGAVRQHPPPRPLRVSANSATATAARSMRVRRTKGWEGLLVKARAVRLSRRQAQPRVAKLKITNAGRVRRRRLDRAAGRAQAFRCRSSSARYAPPTARWTTPAMSAPAIQRRRARARGGPAAGAGHRHVPVCAPSPRRSEPALGRAELVAQVRYTEMTDEGRLAPSRVSGTERRQAGRSDGAGTPHRAPLRRSPRRRMRAPTTDRRRRRHRPARRRASGSRPGAAAIR